jgi:hypothetical protein
MRESRKCQEMVGQICPLSLSGRRDYFSMQGRTPLSLGQICISGSSHVLTTACSLFANNPPLGKTEYRVKTAVSVESLSRVHWLHCARSDRYRIKEQLRGFQSER